MTLLEETYKTRLLGINPLILKAKAEYEYLSFTSANQKQLTI